MSKRSFVIGTTAAVVTAVSFVGIQIANPSWAGFRSSPKEVVDEVWQIVNREYVDATFNQTDWESKRRDLLDRDYASDEQAYDAIREALEDLDDPYTRFLDPKQYASMQIDTSGELTGVGITLSANEENERLTVVSPVEGSPAFKAGIQARDIITAIDGTSTEGMDINSAVNLIRGEEGTVVKLSILREETGEELDFDITRARIELQAVRHEMRDEGGYQVGYVRLTQFSGNAAEGMRAAVKELETDGVDGYILDLRSNPGGLLYSSAEIARMFLREGGIVSTINRKGIPDKISANRRSLTDKPLVVLVDGGSASASEILSGALQDNNRAIIVGTQTFGKGLVQQVHSLSGGAGLAVTIARYRTPNGTDIDKKGILPDIEIEMTDADIERLSNDRELVATPDDPQYATALKALTRRMAGESRSQIISSSLTPAVN
ncbi:MAG: S41 family peptidase [Cyanobacteria bacterium J06639_1]